MKPPTKIFCIGFQKTGTTSLGMALRMLGYDVCSPYGRMIVTNPHIARKATSWAISKLPYHDAFEDNPWPLLYKELDYLCPGSKFILTTRNPKGWIRSMRKYFGDYQAAAEEWIYGENCTPLRNPRRCLKRYKQHNRDVRSYFKGRDNDLLELDLSEGDNWEKLCGFLGHKIPAAPFPMSLKSGSLHTKLQRHGVGLFGTARTLLHRQIQPHYQKLADTLHYHAPYGQGHSS